MNITLNNRPEEIPDHDQLTVQDLLRLKNFTFKFLAVRINGKPVRADQFADSTITDGDKVIIHHLISGG